MGIREKYDSLRIWATLSDQLEDLDRIEDRFRREGAKTPPAIAVAEEHIRKAKASLEAYADTPSEPGP